MLCEEEALVAASGPTAGAKLELGYVTSAAPSSLDADSRMGRGTLAVPRSREGAV